MPLRPFEDLIRFWDCSESQIPVQGADSKDVAALEKKYKVTLPKDFKDYLLFASPAEFEIDKSDGQWWPLKNIKNIPEEFGQKLTNKSVAKDAHYFLFFADFAFWCWAWAICCMEGPNYGRIAVIDGANDRFAWDCFASFVKAHVKDESCLE